MAYNLAGSVRSSPDELCLHVLSTDLVNLGDFLVQWSRFVMLFS